MIAISQPMLVQQTAPADPTQPGLAAYDGRSGVTVLPGVPGLTMVSVEKLGIDRTVHYVRWSEGVLSGEVVIETADEPSYAGPWTLIETVTFSGQSPKQDNVVVTGAYGCFRHRITVPVVGGSVSTKIVGNE